MGAACALFCASTQAQSQQRVEIPNAVTQPAQSEIEARQQAETGRAVQPLGDTTIQFTSQRAPANAAEIRFQLPGIDVRGATVFDEAALSASYGEDIGGEVTLARIYEIAGEIQALYRDADYIFTRVVVPAQEIDGGVVALEVIEARVTSVRIEEPDGPVGPVIALVEAMVEPIIGVTNPTGSMLERALLNVNEIPGITRATAVPQADPDDERGGLQIFVNVERESYEGAFFADNRQTQGIGRGLAGVTLQFNGYSEAGDTTAITVLNSFAYRNDVTQSGVSDSALDFDERNTVQIVHQRNIGADGATIEGSALFSRTRPGDDLEDAGIQGEQVLFTAGVNYPVVRSRQVQFNVKAGAEFLRSTTDVANGNLRVADDRLRVAAVAGDLVMRDAVGYTRANLSFRQGLDILDASPNTAADRSRDDGRNDFSLIRGGIERLVIVNENFSFLGKFGGQYAFNPLLASEEFAIGGISFGRGLDPSLFTGDDGIGLSGEMRYLVPVSIEDFAFTLEAFSFAEYGKIWNKGDGQPTTADLLTLGGGVRLFFPEDYTLGLEVAAPAFVNPANSVPDTVEVGDPRLFVNFSKRF